MITHHHRQRPARTATRILLVLLAASAIPAAATTTTANPSDPGQGELCVRTGDRAGQRFPLAHTAVDARIDGIVARVRVTQIYDNPYPDKIEAIYIFPLPDRAAVDDMEMKVGTRTIHGRIERREEARRMYEEARTRGHVASLLDQERPNIFTQSVANILPGNKIEVTIRYVETLVPNEGAYRFVFPMVVGPRFIPGTPVGPPLAAQRPMPLIAPVSGPGWAPDTDQVPDASRITPPVLRPEERSGHDIAVTLAIEAGLPIRELESPSHAIDIERKRPEHAVITLHPADTIPNKDLVVRYRLSGAEPEIAVLTHRQDGDGTFLALIVPPARPGAADIMPKEMVFVVDCSGSMSGEPIAKVKQAMRHALKNLDPRDSFQIIRFSESASGLGPRPLPATPDNLKEGLRFIDQLNGGGGTMMIEGIKAALDFPPDPERLRIVSFMTDGYIGNEAEILAAIEMRLGGSRLFAFGIGNAVNRYLLDRMAEIGRGSVDYVLLGEDTHRAVARFYDRVKNPVLTDLEFTGDGELALADVYPERIPDLFAGQAVMLVGRYTAPGQAVVTLRGKLGGKPWARNFTVDLPARTDARSEALGSVWARTRIEALMAQQYGGERPELREEVTRIALAHRLMSPYTSFVAVEERIEVAGGVPRTVVVPVEMPEGVSYEGVFGEGDEAPGHAGKSGAWGGLKSQVASLGSGFRGGVIATTPKPGGAAPPPAAGNEPRAEWGAPHAAGSTALCGPGASSATLRATIAADRDHATKGETITLRITLTNISGAPITIPAKLTLDSGQIRLRIIDGSWQETETGRSSGGEGRPAAGGRTRTLASGASLTVSIKIGGRHGYSLPGAGMVHIAVAQVGGLPVDSEVVTLRIEP